MELAYIPLSEDQGTSGTEAEEVIEEQGDEDQPSPLEKLVEALEDVSDCVRVWTS
jgi:transcriptional/translational regulatory protein YebC/TACO1